MKKTILYRWHKERAQIVPFAGYLMPILYTSIKNESIWVRKYCGIFDVSHMGKIFIKGQKAQAFVDRIFPMKLKEAQDYQALYGYLLNENGGIIDDLILYKFPNYFMVIVNASNREKVFNKLIELKDNQIEIEDQSEKYSIIAVQGPASKEVICRVLQSEINIKRYHFTILRYGNEELILARTGYTGEEGYEIVVKNEYAPKIWEELFNRDDKIVPCGLGARDILRLEASYPLYGHELNEKVTPLHVNGEKFVDLEKEFIGKKALISLKNNIKTSLVGFELDGKHIARQKDKVLDGDKVIGEITSGSYSFNFNKSIALGFIEKEYRANDTSITIQHQKGTSTAKVINEPFLKYYRKSGN
jgi:aminomethyltransferase